MSELRWIPTASQSDAQRTLRSWLNHEADTTAPLSLLTGESGSGRSRLVHELIADDDAIIAVHLSADASNGTDTRFLRGIIEAFGGDPTGRTGLRLRADMRATLKQRPPHNGHLLIVDNAAFPGPRLELVRTILQDNRAARLRILLIGTPDLADRVHRRRSLSAQLGADVALAPPVAEDVRRQLLARIAFDAVDLVIQDDAIDSILNLTAGRIEDVIRICDHLGTTLRESGEDHISPALVRRATRSAISNQSNADGFSPGRFGGLLLSHRSSPATTRNGITEPLNGDADDTD